MYLDRGPGKKNHRSSVAPKVTIRRKGRSIQVPTKKLNSSERQDFAKPLLICLNGSDSECS